MNSIVNMNQKITYYENKQIKIAYYGVGGSLLYLTFRCGHLLPELMVTSILLGHGPQHHHSQQFIYKCKYGNTKQPHLNITHGQKNKGSETTPNIWMFQHFNIPNYFKGGIAKYRKMGHWYYGHKSLLRVKITSTSQQYF